MALAFQQAEYSWMALEIVSAAIKVVSGRAGLLFRRNSVTGSVEAITRPGRQVSLSTDLHARQ